MAGDRRADRAQVETPPYLPSLLVERVILTLKEVQTHSVNRMGGCAERQPLLDPTRLIFTCIICLVLSFSIRCASHLADALAVAFC